MVEIVFDKNLSHAFGHMNNRGLNLFKIIANQNATIVINKELMEYFSEEVSTIEIKEKWEALILELAHNNRIKATKRVLNKLDSEEVYQNASIANNNAVFILKDAIATMPHHIPLLSNNLSDQIVHDIASTNKFNLTGIDFNTNDEIDSFFCRLFTCMPSSNRIIVVSRYANFDCNFISCLNSHYQKKEYWTLKNTHDLSNNKAFVQKKLGNQLKHFFVRTKKDLHERRIIINSMILSFDNDFINIEANKETWACQCEINRDKARKFRESKNLIEIFH